jgi:hydrophobe/amphiphile efflux-1 (HAE1) family protein
VKFTDIFVQRPVLSVVISLLILILGVQAIGSMGIREYPKLEFTQIIVQTAYPGASPRVVQSTITTKLQQAVAGSEGIDTISASSTVGLSTLTLTVQLGADSDRAFTDVMTKVNSARFDLPREAFDPAIRRISNEGTGLMYIDFRSTSLTTSQITDFLVRQVQPALQAIPGVASAEILGAQNFAMRVWLKPDRMAALQVTAMDVRKALEDNNFTAAPGELKSSFIRATIDAQTDLSNVQQFRQLVVASREGALVRLGDVADVDLGPEAVSFSSYAKGKRALFIEIRAAPGANPLVIAPLVRERIEQLRPQLPVGLIADVSYDATNYINAAIDEVILTVLEAALIVCVVVYLFLGSVRATLIPLVTIPLSLIGVLFLMQLLGYSINLLTLLAIVLSIGLVVDDAIVVLENISRHIEEGMNPTKAALVGAREIAGPVIGMTLTLAAVYAPIGFVTGLTGALFQEFAFTLAAAVVISGILALTLSPMMCSKVLRSHEQDKFALWLDAKFEKLKNSYVRRLTRALGARKLMVGAGALVLASCFMLYQTSDKTLAPEEDQGFTYMFWKAPQWTNLDYLNAYVETFHPMLSKYPEYANSFLINNGLDAAGFGGMIFKPWNERDKTSFQLIPQIQAELGQVAGLQAFVFNVPPLPLPQVGDGSPIQFVLQSTESYDKMLAAAEQLKQAADQSGMFLFTNLSLTFDKPQVTVRINREKANQLGVSMADIGNTLGTLLGGNYVNLFDMQGRSYRVVPQVPRTYRLDANLINTYYVRTASGALAPLSTFVTLERGVEPNALTTFQQLNSVSISGVPMIGRTMGEAIGFLEAEAARTLPAGYSYDFDGESRQFKREGQTLAVAFGLALIIIFLVLAAQFESFRDPVIILVSVPMSICGALLVINLAGMIPPDVKAAWSSIAPIHALSINIYTQIGMVTLIGLISKHGILMVEFANTLQEQKGLDRREAILEAAGIRLRPILMTTAAMVAGVVPLLLASGAGASSRFAIGAVIASGMTIGTLFTLFIVPVMYSLMARDHKGDAAKRAAMLAEPQPAE